MPSMGFLDLTCTCHAAVDFTDHDNDWIIIEGPNKFVAGFLVNSKWFLQGVGLDGLNKMLDGFSDRSASAFCTIAYSRGPGTEPILFDGRVQVSAPSRS